MSGKIHISWDDVNSTAVDEKLKERAAVARAEQQFFGSSGTGFGWNSLVYNAFVYMPAFGFVGGLLAWVFGEALIFVFLGNQLAAGVDDSRRVAGLLIWIAIFMPTVAMTLAFFLSIADQAVSRNWHGVVVSGAIGIVLGVVSGFVGMFLLITVSAVLRDLVLGPDELSPSYFRRIVFRTIGWTLIGGILSIGPGIVMKNWKRLLIGFAGGVLGGVVAGVLFDLIAIPFDSGVPSRFVGFVAIGSVAGLGTGIIEAAAKSGWLKVVAGLIAGKQFVLYKSPTIVGSSPQCEIYLFKDPSISPRHAAIHRIGGGYDIEDLRSETGTLVNGNSVKRQRLKKGDRVQIGDTVFVFQERGR